MANMEIKEEKGKKNVVHARSDIHLKHTLYLDGTEAETNWTLPWKPSYDHHMMSHVPPKRYGTIDMLVCAWHMPDNLFF